MGMGMSSEDAYYAPPCEVQGTIRGRVSLLSAACVIFLLGQSHLLWWYLQNDHAGADPTDLPVLVDRDPTDPPPRAHPRSRRSPDGAGAGPSRCRCVDCDRDELCGGLWRANRYPGTTSLEAARRRRVHVVVSHCKKELGWMGGYLDGFNVASVRVISKCGADVARAPGGATVERLPNVGRCDHSYAHFLANVLPHMSDRGDEDDSVVAFLKDDVSRENLHQPNHVINDFGTMISVASSSNGFACGIVPRRVSAVSAYHDRDVLFRFNMTEYERNRAGYEGTDGDAEFASPYETLGAFHAALCVAEEAPDLVPVCYGGVFAASVRSIRAQEVSVWRRMEGLLARGNNIQEGHYAERSWAHLLSKPLEPFQMEAMRNVTTGFAQAVVGIYGALIGGKERFGQKRRKRRRQGGVHR